MLSHSVWTVSVVIYSGVCWGRKVRADDASRINRLIRKAGSIFGVQLDFLEEVTERRML